MVLVMREVLLSFNSDFSEITLDSRWSAATYSGNVTRRRAKLDDQDQTANIFAWPRTGLRHMMQTL